MTVRSSGMDILRRSGDSFYTLRVRDYQGVWEFRNRQFNCLNPSNPDAAGSEMVIQDTPNGDNRVRIGNASNCRVGIGATNVLGYVLTVGGLSQFQNLKINQDLTLTGQQLLNTRAPTGRR